MPEKYNAIGLMSGTSLDGLDIAYVEFLFENHSWQYNILKTISIDYQVSRRLELAQAFYLEKGALAILHKEYGSWLGEQADNFIKDNNIEPDLIASHGHTVFHEPEKGITLQIGDGQAIADRTGITVVCNFRSHDVRLGGQGAPLVPIGDRLLFREYPACLNLGGIANISYELDNERIAFDIGMANLPLNHFARELGLPYDEDGILARKGAVNDDLLKQLNGLSFYNQAPPKSLGLEWFVNEMLPLVNAFNITTEDKLATLANHQALQIVKTISSIGSTSKILVTGGGVYNKFFIDLIQQNLPSDYILEIPENQIINYKEALIFALMGVLRQRNEINCLKSVTGAREDSSSGEVFLPRVS
jgi:anhydro-N-acetylmuramic acid kinase